MNPLAWLNGQVGRAQRRWPVLRKLDDAQWKTWAWHAINAIWLGYVIALLPWITPVWGGRIVVAMYIWREWNQLKAKESPTPGELLDHTLDAIVPFVANEVWHLFF